MRSQIELQRCQRGSMPSSPGCSFGSGTGSCLQSGIERRRWSAAIRLTRWSRTGAGEADDDRAFDLHVVDLGVALQQVVDPQPRRRVPHAVSKRIIRPSAVRLSSAFISSNQTPSRSFQSSGPQQEAGPPPRQRSATAGTERSIVCTSPRSRGPPSGRASARGSPDPRYGSSRQPRDSSPGRGCAMTGALRRGDRASLFGVLRASG